jgi:transcriptional regulator with PAS, ATPase and Fis domain
MNVIELTDEGRLMLENYRWPGNVRQLKNMQLLQRKYSPKKER